MLGSTIINHRQHVGLQKLAALAGITHSSLGPNKKYKFIQDEASGESALVCSCFRIFENLELSCAVGQLVHETIQAHQKVYHTGSGCLLFLAGAWSRAALECLQRGIPVTHIISAMSEGMDICINVCRKSSVSTEGLDVEPSESFNGKSHALGFQLKQRVGHSDSLKLCTWQAAGMEDRFWACAYRLHHMLEDKVLLPGAGVTEMLCVHHLQREAEKHVKHHRETNRDSAANPYRGEVLNLMADGLSDYISTVMVNTGRFSKVKAMTAVRQQLHDNNESLDAKFSQLSLEGEEEDSGVSLPMISSKAPAVKIYDNLSVKQEAWRKALDLVVLVLQTDAEVITGIDQTSDDTQEKLIML
ncbi:Bardet-Biedl syndrome 12 protein like [Dissostichus eleginoides]|uniref:Bardet-Biedl syndrome 12 protein like n=1 Tax=Dissostichus eleginoides TaxID=100907 RepID=A0AAD9CL90_DISEL|nr:Bardet-Biedl syndrome 12 protein like [Dissostichus eleginoides]